MSRTEIGEEFNIFNSIHLTKIKFKDHNIYKILSEFRRALVIGNNVEKLLRHIEGFLAFERNLVADLL